MPERTCAICRKRGEKSELIRFVVQRINGGAPKIVLDALHRSEGRGFYAHRAVGCLLAKRFADQVQRAARAGEGAALGERGILQLIDEAIKPLAVISKESEISKKSGGLRNAESTKEKTRAMLIALRVELERANENAGRPKPKKVRL